MKKITVTPKNITQKTPSIVKKVFYFIFALVISFSAYAETSDRFTEKQKKTIHQDGLFGIAILGIAAKTFFGYQIDPTKLK